MFDGACFDNSGISLQNVTDEMRNNQLMALISQSNNAPGEITSEDFQTPTSPPASHADFKQTATTRALHLKKPASSIDSHQSSSIDSGRSKLPKHISFEWLSIKNRHEKKIQEIEFTKPDDRCEFNGPSLSENLSAFQSTYSKVSFFHRLNVWLAVYSLSFDCYLP